jgi:hypothetical protein
VFHTAAAASITHECAVDLSALEGALVWTACTSPVSYTGTQLAAIAAAESGLLESQFRFRVRALDTVTGLRSAAAGYPWTIDITPPEAPTVGDGPPLHTTDTTATFEFGDDVGGTAGAFHTFDAGPGDTFECALDGGTSPEYESCTSPKTYTDLDPGDHVFRLRTVDSAGNPSATADEWDWTIDPLDTEGPTVTITGGPEAESSTNSTTATFTFTVDDPTATVTCSLDGGEAVDPCTSGVSFESLDDGVHIFEVDATDEADNVGSDSRTWTVDTEAPDMPVITDGPDSVVSAHSTAFAFEAASEEGDFLTASESEAVTFECALDSDEDSSYEACESPKSYDSLSDGGHVFRVRAVDAAGNRSDGERWDWTIDSGAPETSITSGPEDGEATNQTSVTFGYSSTEASDYTCALDDEPVNCHLILRATSSSTNLTGLADGSHTFTVVATDAAGNQDPTPASRTFTVDTEAPTTQIDSYPTNPTTSSGAVFTFSATDPDPSSGGVTFECWLHDTSATPPPAAFDDCESGDDFGPVAVGDHTFEVRAVDDAGNEGDPATFSWTRNNPPNNAPTAESFSTGAHAGANVIDIFHTAHHASDPDGDALTFELVTGPSDGTVTDTLHDGTVTYTPNTSFTSGTDAFRYRVVDSHGANSTTESITVHVSPTGQAVTIHLHWATTTTRDLDLHVELPSPFGHVYYGNRNPQPWASQDHDWTGYGPADETTTITPNGPTFEAGSYVVTIDNYGCNDSFLHTDASVTFTFADGSAPVTVTLPKTSNLKDWQVATVSLNAVGGPASFTTTNTFDGGSCGPASAANAHANAHRRHGHRGATGASGGGGSQTGSGAGESAGDGRGASSGHHHDSSSDGPRPVVRAGPDNYTATAGEQLRVSARFGVLSNDGSSAGSTLRVWRHDMPRHGTLQLLADGSFVYTPAADFSGEDRFGYVATDGRVESSIAHVSIVVSPAETSSSAESSDQSGGIVWAVPPFLVIAVGRVRSRGRRPKHR